MNVIEYFDSQNPEHISAFLHLNKTGNWPKEFYEKLEAANVEFPTCWQVSIAGNLAIEYARILDQKGIV